MYIIYIYIYIYIYKTFFSRVQLHPKQITLLGSTLSRLKKETLLRIYLNLSLHCRESKKSPTHAHTCTHNACTIHVLRVIARQSMCSSIHVLINTWCSSIHVLVNTCARQYMCLSIHVLINTCYHQYMCIREMEYQYTREKWLLSWCCELLIVDVQCACAGVEDSLPETLHFIDWLSEWLSINQCFVCSSMYFFN